MQVYFRDLVVDGDRIEYHLDLHLDEVMRPCSERRTRPRPAYPRQG